MEKIEQKINGFIGMTIASTLILTALGLVFFILPGTILNVLRWIMVAILVMTGFGMILRSVSRNGSAGIVVGIIFFMLGLLIAMHPETLNIVMIIIGLYMIINSISSLLFMQNIRNTTIYLMTIISNVIGLICGVVLFVHPGESTEMVMQVAGVLMMIYGISGLIEAITIKARVEEVKNNFKSAKKTAKKLLDDAKEAEIVDNKSKK